jgi:hypothetical protein
MQLITMHKVLIRTAIAGGVLFCAWSIYTWSVSGATRSLVMAGVSGVITAAMTVYLRHFVRKNQPQDAA